MSLEALAARGDAVGATSAERARDDLIARASLPPGVKIEPMPEGVVLSGKRLRHRYVTDQNLRNFAR